MKNLIPQIRHWLDIENPNSDWDKDHYAERGSLPTRRETPMIYRIVVMLVLAVLAGFILFACARPQPMGEDIWKGVAYTEKNLLRK